MSKITQKAARGIADLVNQYANFTKISKIKEREMLAAEKANDGVALDRAKADYYIAERVVYQCAIALHENYGIEVDALDIARRHIDFVCKQEVFYDQRVKAQKAHAINVAVAAAARQG